MQCIKASLAATILCLGVSPAFGQQILGPNPIIAGVPVQCGGVVTAVAPNLPYIAVASPGYITLRPDFFHEPPLKQIFIYAHECGHHVVGSSESGADCFAVKLGRNQGWLSSQGLRTICAADYWQPGDWTHLPGPMRCQQMAVCYQSP